jgi:arabinogalactan oligomer/maltooligosaccharide transport system substrate-binding protein
MMQRRFLVAIAACIAAAFAWPAAAANLVVWHGYRGEEKAALEKVVDAYNAQIGADGTKVSLLAVPADAFLDKVTAAVPRGQGPDAFIGPQDRLGGWVESGKTIDPIGFYVDDATRERFFPTTIQSMTYRGQLYGLPLNYKVITLIYNKKLVSSPPKTTGELETLAKKLTDRQGGKFGLAFPYNDFYYVASLLNGFGGRVFDGTRPDLNDPANVKAMGLLTKWQKEFLPAEPSTALITSLFNQGKAAMVFSGPWFLGEIDKSIDYGLATLPTIDEAGGKPMRPWMTVEGVFVAAPSSHKDAAYKFAKYLTDLSAAETMALQGRQTPANQKVYLQPKVKADPVLAAFFKQVKTAVPMPNIPEMTMMWGPATAALGAISRGTSPKVALDKANGQLTRQVSALQQSRGPAASGTGSGTGTAP